MGSSTHLSRRLVTTDTMLAGIFIRPKAVIAPYSSCYPSKSAPSKDHDSASGCEGKDGKVGNVQEHQGGRNAAGSRSGDTETRQLFGVINLSFNQKFPLPICLVFQEPTCCVWISDRISDVSL